MYENIPPQKVLDVVKQGPTLPVKIAKQVGGDTMIVGAVLSSLISLGQVRASSLKIGGSPLYYSPEHEARLEEFSNYLNEKDRKSMQLLKEKSVLRDSDLDPLTRVSLRAIKDFARQFEMSMGQEKQLFWRYFLVQKEDAASIAADMLKKEQDMMQQRFAAEEKEMQRQESEKRIESERLAREAARQELLKKQESVIKTQLIHATEEANRIPTATIVKDANQELHDIIDDAHLLHNAQTHAPHHQHKSSGHVQHDASKHYGTDKENFFELIRKHLSSIGLDIITKEKIKRSEYDIVVKNHQTNEYIFCKAKDKRSINEGDLASAFVFAQNKRMPCLFIATGELTKKASSIIEKEFSGLVFERIL